MKMKKYKKRIVPDYDNKYVDTDPEYYGVFFERENQKVVSVKVDPKRLRKTKLIDQDIYNEIQSVNRNTPYFHPAKKMAEKNCCDVFREHVNGLRKLWIQEVKPAIEKLKTPEQVGNDKALHSTADGILDFDEVNMVRAMEKIQRMPSYENAVKMFYAQFVLLLGAEIEAAMVKVITQKGYVAEKFSRECLKGYVSGRVAGLDYTKFDNHNSYDKIYKLWNFLKHNNSDVYSKVQETYPELLLDANAKYKNGDLAVWFLNLSEKVILELLDGVSRFFDEFCNKVFGETTDYQNWNTETFYVQLVQSKIDDIINPLGLPKYI